MDHIMVAVAGKKAAKAMLEERDLHKFASVLASAPVEKKWVAGELAVAVESKQVVGAIITEVVLDLVRFFNCLLVFQILVLYVQLNWISCSSR
jgi:hypothetical protein